MTSTTTTTTDLLDRVHATGTVLLPAGNKIKMRGPAPLHEDLRMELRSRKSEILRALGAYEDDLHRFKSSLANRDWTDLRTRIEPEDETVETKKRLSIFHPTDLDFLLRNMGVRAVVFNGGFTDCCVLNAAFDASNLDYRVVVAQDLVRGTNAEMEDAALKMMSLHMALVMESGDLLEAWDARGAKASQAAE